MVCLPLLKRIELLTICPLKELVHFLITLLRNERERDHTRFCLDSKLIYENNEKKNNAEPEIPE